MNIVIPMAGRGKRFAEAGYTTPKPFLPIDCQPMIQRVMENIAQLGDTIYLIALQEHIAHFTVQQLTGAYLSLLDGVTEGAACTVLTLREHIDNDEPLLIANSDQWIDYDREAFRAFCKENDGVLLTCERNDPKYSYCALDEDGNVSCVVEKRVISRHATCGVYYWRRGRDFVSSAVQMIREEDRYKGEFYIAPTYSYRPEGYVVKPFPCREMYLLGTPEEYEANLPIVTAKLRAGAR